MKKIRLIYCGERMDQAGNRYASFVTERGKEVNFVKPPKLAWIGHTYEAEKRKGGIIIRAYPKELSDVLHPKTDRWMALEQVAMTEFRKRRTRRRLEERQDLMQELRIIRSIVKDLHYTEKKAFVEWVVNKIESMEK